MIAMPLKTKSDAGDKKVTLPVGGMQYAKSPPGMMQANLLQGVLQSLTVWTHCSYS